MHSPIWTIQQWPLRHSILTLSVILSLFLFRYDSEKYMATHWYRLSIEQNMLKRHELRNIDVITHCCSLFLLAMNLLHFIASQMQIEFLSADVEHWIIFFFMEIMVKKIHRKNEIFVWSLKNWCNPSNLGQFHKT